MTKDEAIAILRQEREGICTDIQCTMTMYRDFSGVDNCNQDCEEREAYDMAIEALQAEPVKHGEWINKRLTKDSMEDIKDGTYGELIGYHDICSVCGFDIDNFWYATGKPRYCPNCGAKMDGGK